MRLNKAQRVVIVIGVVALVITGLITPWVAILDIELEEGSGVYLEMRAGYSAIWSRPTFQLQGIRPPTMNRWWYVRLDTRVLAVEWVLVSLVVVGLSVALKS